MRTLHRSVAGLIAVGLIAVFAPNPRTVAATGPIITAISGTIAHGSSVTVSGTGFGTKATAAPRKFDNFENGTNGSVVGNGWTVDNTYPPTYSSVVTRPNSSMSARSNFINSTWASNFGITGESMPRIYIDAWYYLDTALPYSRNHKVFRFHANGTGLPNLYFNLYCEGYSAHLSQDGVSGGNFDSWPALSTDAFARKWSHLQGYFVQSTPGVDDGTAVLWVNGVAQVDDIGNFRTRDVGSDPWDTIWFGNYLDHGSDGHCAAYPADAYTYWDDVYVDYTSARVELGDAATYAASRHREIQLPTGWSDTSITMTLNRGSFPDFTGLYLYVVDDAGNVSPGFPIGTSSPDTTPPTVTGVSPAAGATAISPASTIEATFSEPMNAATISASTVLLFDGSGAPVPSNVTYDATTRTATIAPSVALGSLATYAVTVTTGVTDVAGNALAANVSWSFTTASTSGLVAAYGFEEGGGTTAYDRGGRNDGTVSGATWVPGKFGDGLWFNGTSASVMIPDDPSLHLRTGMTLEAWVNPTALTGWRTAVLKEAPGDLAYALYASDGSTPLTTITAGVARKYDYGSTMLPLNTWTHLAGTYDGATLRFFVNGTLVNHVKKTGAIEVTADPLRIGGNAVWGEYFAGIIDEVRVYNRALSAKEIQADMTRPIGPIAQPPAPPSNVHIIP